MGGGTDPPFLLEFFQNSTSNPDPLQPPPHPPSPTHPTTFRRARTGVAGDQPPEVSEGPAGAPVHRDYNPVLYRVQPQRHHSRRWGPMALMGSLGAPSPGGGDGTKRA